MNLVIRELTAAHTPIRAAIFDFDGTISTLRCGWEAVMEKVMLERLRPSGLAEDALRQRIRSYIEESTGIQTIYQMEWLAEQVQTLCGIQPLDAWSYKDEYNAALLNMVDERVRALEDGRARPEDFLIPGSAEYLRLLRKHGVAIYIASGTDDADVQREAALLGIQPLVERVQGAPHRQKNCSKEAVLRELADAGRYQGRELLVVGDGKVEILLGHEKGAITVGLATQERRLNGELDPKKRERLLKAGADYVLPDCEPLLALWHAEA